MGFNRETKEIIDYIEMHHQHSTPFSAEKRVLKEEDLESTSIIISHKGEQITLIEDEPKLLIEALLYLIYGTHFNTDRLIKEIFNADAPTEGGITSHRTGVSNGQPKD